MRCDHPSTRTTSARTVITIDPATDPRWDRYVERHPDACAYHLGDWARVLRGAYGFKPRYLAVVGADGALAGALPTMSSAGLVTGRRLRSLPIVPPVDPLGSSDDDVHALISAACDAADERRSAWVMHARGPGYAELVPRVTRDVSGHPTWVLRLPRDPDELMQSWKRSSNNLYRSIRKTFKNGITIREASSAQDLKRLYRLYVITLRRHHALPRAYRQFVLDWKLLGPRGAAKVFLAEHEGRLIAGALFHGFGRDADLLYNGSDPAHFDLRPNHALYWHAINWAIEEGREQFDFGQARPDHSLARFKAQWGTEPVTEFRYDYPPKATRADILRRSTDARRGDRRGRAIRAAWERAPAPLLRAAGTIAYRFL
jgi:peptidoglycan pentaglycine glycine transferase (the first glycine)